MLAYGIENWIYVDGVGAVVPTDPTMHHVDGYMDDLPLHNLQPFNAPATNLGTLQTQFQFTMAAQWRPRSATTSP